MNREAAAAYIGVEAQTLANWASTGKVRIPFLKIGRKVTYLKSDLDVYLASSKASTTR
ncbi:MULTISPECIES: helix-turn-helix domain-containing protein [Enterobacteriaceae]|nr:MULTISPECIES: helix-turn-helix domain-containing protein [Citrobacter]MCB6152474.1 helix-turn-helix domain-containing protein [Escherichia coli]MDA6496733.1 helix-turn-helix domain-containing protein [Escherichia coli]MDH1296867.1 helix-turn-helix domain-containing protein [Citrobacter freundii]MDM3096905.1 helix-turn-helix domain-containing protein [Citrobacter sp. Cf140]MDM3107332.1 helix-turn-helix domain-containing protein [Citrobacter sp. Cf132]